MNIPLLIAAGLSALGGVLHSFLGERLILMKMSVATLPPTLGPPEFILRVLRLFWHMVSVLWWGLAGFFVFAARGGDLRVPVLIISATFLASALLSLVVSRGKHFSWGILLVIAVCGWLGAG